MQFHAIRFLLGEELNGNFYEVSSFEEALSLLNTEHENVGVKYWSENLLEFVERGGARHVSEEKIISIFEEYNSEEKSEEEKRRILTKLKEEAETEIVIDFILRMRIKETANIDFLKEIIEYIFEHIDDDVLRSDFNRVREFIGDLFGIKLKMTNEKSKNKGTVREVKFKGEDLSGIISELKRIDGEDLEGSGSLKLTGGGYPQHSYPLTNLI